MYFSGEMIHGFILILKSVWTHESSVRAMAFIEGSKIAIEGSKIALASEWTGTAVLSFPTSFLQALLFQLIGATALAMEVSVSATPANPA